MSSLKDLASLIMVPSLYKDGELHTVKPLADENIIVHPDATDNNDGFDGSTPSTSSNFTFSRGSNLAATRVDVNGLIEKGRENLFVQSNQFDTTWILNSATITDGQSGYDGTNNAWKLQDTAVSGEHFVRQTPNVGNIVSVSVYAKANTLNFLWLRSVQSGVNKRTWFDLSSGSVGTSQGIDANIESVGNGWYRCSATFNHQTAFEYYIAISDANGSSSYAGTGNGSIYIQDAQLEQGLVATDYIETTTTSVSAGILEDMPRLDYSGSCPSLLLEPQRTNLYTHSEYGGIWNKTLATITDNYAVSPEGLQNAFRANFSSNSGLIYVSGTGATGQDNTLSVWAKSNTGTDQVFRFFANGNTIKSDNFTATNEWQRFTYTHNCTNVTAGITGNSAGGTSDILFYGFQQEAGSYPTSYIPTYGTSQTRSRDFMNEQISGLTSLEQGTFFLDFDRGLTTATTRDASADGFNYRSTSSFPSNTAIEIATDIGGAVRLALRLGSFNGIYSDNTLSRYKMLVKWSGSEVKAYVNGSLEYSSSVKWGDALAPLQYIGYNATFRKSVNQLLTFPTALTDSECIALTTL